LVIHKNVNATYMMLNDVEGDSLFWC